MDYLKWLVTKGWVKTLIMLYGLGALAAGIGMVIVCISILNSNALIMNYFSIFPLSDKFNDNDQTLILAFFIKEIFKNMIISPSLIIMILSVGILTTIHGISGLYAIFSENTFLVSMFKLATLIMTIISIVLSIIVILYKITPMDQRFRELLRTRYATNKTELGTSFTKAMDIIQAKEQCCGFVGIQDYQTSFYLKTTKNKVPESCCKDSEVIDHLQMCITKAIPELTHINGCNKSIGNFQNTFWVYYLIGVYIFANVVVMILCYIEESYAPEQSKLPLVIPQGMGTIMSKGVGESSKKYGEEASDASTSHY